RHPRAIRRDHITVLQRRPLAAARHQIHILLPNRRRTMHIGGQIRRNIGTRIQRQHRLHTRIRQVHLRHLADLPPPKRPIPPPTQPPPPPPPPPPTMKHPHPKNPPTKKPQKKTPPPPPATAEITAKTDNVIIVRRCKRISRPLIELVRSNQRVARGVGAGHHPEGAAPLHLEFGQIALPPGADEH